jgi:hypothetical protein
MFYRAVKNNFGKFYGVVRGSTIPQLMYKANELKKKGYRIYGTIFRSK